jgi:hypothetical protein
MGPLASGFAAGTGTHGRDTRRGLLGRREQSAPAPALDPARFLRYAFVVMPLVPNLEFSADDMRRMADAVITAAVAGGRYLGRVCVLSFRTHAEQIDWLVEDVEAALSEIGG